MTQRAATRQRVTSRAESGDRVYVNRGNRPLVELLGASGGRVLDVGCGTGDTGALITADNPAFSLYGITHSAAEASVARQRMTECWIMDIEQELPAHLEEQRFDVLLLSHVLEHLREPDVVLSRFARLLRSGGEALIAVPNVMFWRMRLQFARGRFEYETAGILDDTHLRFFTFETADSYLLARSPELVVTHKLAHGSVPLRWLRRRPFPAGLGARIDAWGCRRWPNLFGGQVLIRAVKT